MCTITALTVIISAVGTRILGRTGAQVAIDKVSASSPVEAGVRRAFVDIGLAV